MQLPADVVADCQGCGRDHGADRPGRLEPGLRADLVVVEAASRRIEATVSGGRLTYLSGEAARRFLAQPRIVSAFEEGNQRAAE